MECFRIDESGHTGFDLLNPEQRFQGATAIGISDEEAARLMKEHWAIIVSSTISPNSGDSGRLPRRGADRLFRSPLSRPAKKLTVPRQGGKTPLLLGQWQLRVDCPMSGSNELEA